MFDFDAGKLIIIGIVALIVIGPKELPRVMRQVGQVVGKLRRLATDFQSQFMEAMREAEFAELKAEAAKLADAAKLNVDFNPVNDVKAELTSALENDSRPPAQPEIDSKAAALASNSHSETVATDAVPQAETASSAETGSTVPAAASEPAPATVEKPAEPHPASHLAAEPLTSLSVEPASAPEPLPLRNSA